MYILFTTYFNNPKFSKFLFVKLYTSVKNEIIFLNSYFSLFFVFFSKILLERIHSLLPYSGTLTMYFTSENEKKKDHGKNHISLDRLTGSEIVVVLSYRVIRVTLRPCPKGEWADYYYDYFDLGIEQKIKDNGSP